MLDQALRSAEARCALEKLDLGTDRDCKSRPSPHLKRIDSAKSTGELLLSQRLLWMRFKARVVYGFYERIQLKRASHFECILRVTAHSTCERPNPPMD